MDAALIDLFAFRPLIEAMRTRYDLILVDAIAPDPTQGDVCAALERFKGKRPDWLIAIGGGSAMDLAKAVQALQGPLLGQELTSHAITRLLQTKAYKGIPKSAQMILVPTTAGTGSEMTRWATLWDAGKDVKYSVEDEDLYAREALLVPELTLRLPKRLTLSTGLDALCHAMEALWAKPTHPVIQAVADQAIRMIRDALPLTLAYPEDPDLRSRMSVASALAGMAFSNTRTTACHSISYPLTLRFHVAHGFASALTLAEVARRNAQALPGLNVRMENLFGGPDGLGRWLSDVCGDIQPLTLSALGIPESDIPSLAQASFTAGRMDNNPVPFGVPEVMEILRSCR